jgi:hypothetical protein
MRENNDPLPYKIGPNPVLNQLRHNLKNMMDSCKMIVEAINKIEKGNK